MSVQLSCDLKNHADLGGFISHEASKFITSLCARWAGIAWATRGLGGLQFNFVGPSIYIYICLFKYTIIILAWSFPVGICIQCDVT